MKDQRNDSNNALSRFGRDKRTRTVTAGAERIERRPHSQRDAADSEQKSFRNDSKPRRTSYNPHFSEDNRPLFGEKSGRERAERGFGEHRGERSFGQHRGERSFGERNFGERRSGAKPYGERSSQDRKFGAGRGDRNFGRKPMYGTYEDEERGSERTLGERKFGNRKFGDRSFGDRDRKFGDRDRKFGSKPYKAYKRNDDRPDYPKYAPEKQAGAIRLNRFLAQSGICSRREADDLIVAGVVSVNGKIVSELGTKVMPDDVVKFNDSRVQGEKKVYLVLNKPKGYVTSLEDPHADKTVMDLVKGACDERIYPVGRLDKNSVGLLLFTNDGDLTKQLTHPTHCKKKIYQVNLDKALTRADMDRLVEGITLEDGEIHADEISYVSDDKQEVGVEIHSGRNRIVRRMFEFCGYEVKKLDRVYYAGLTKKNLKRGMWRFLSDEEVRRLKTGLYE